MTKSSVSRTSFNLDTASRLPASLGSMVSAGLVLYLGGNHDDRRSWSGRKGDERTQRGCCRGPVRLMSQTFNSLLSLNLAHCGRNPSHAGIRALPLRPLKHTNFVGRQHRLNAGHRGRHQTDPVLPACKCTIGSVKPVRGDVAVSCACCDDTPHPIVKT